MENLGDPAGEAACWGCGAVISTGDNYCRVCGKGQGAHVPWQYRHWGVILTALCLGPFALFFVWRSPVISRGAKFAYTAFIAFFTWLAIETFYAVWNHFQAMFGALQGF